MSENKPPVRVAILTVSDSSANGVREDVSGPALASRCADLSWPVIASIVLPDEPEAVTRQLRQWTGDSQATVILTTGGTGITERDSTPEATRRVLQKELPGVAELMRQRGLEQTPFSVLSRAAVGTCNRTLIVNLPGSPSGAVFSLGAIEHLIPHIVQLLAGHTGHA